MTDMMRIVTIGALLHDIGKAIIRASGERKTHSQLGADFFAPFLRHIGGRRSGGALRALSPWEGSQRGASIPG